MPFISLLLTAMVGRATRAGKAKSRDVDKKLGKMEKIWLWMNKSRASAVLEYSEHLA